MCSTQKRDWKRGCVTNVQAHAASAIGPRSRKRFINRELSWLAFNERVRFLSISGTNLDEFYMVRVAGLSAQIKGGIRSLSQDGRTPAQQYRQVNNRAAELMIRQQETWQALGAELAVKGVSVLHPSELKTKDELWLDDHFSHRIFPVLTPLAVDPAHPFPFIPNGGMSLGLSLLGRLDAQEPGAPGRAHGADREPHGPQPGPGRDHGGQPLGYEPELVPTTRPDVPAGGRGPRSVRRTGLLHEQSESFGSRKCAQRLARPCARP